MNDSRTPVSENGNGSASELQADPAVLRINVPRKDFSAGQTMESSSAVRAIEVKSPFGQPSRGREHRGRGEYDCVRAAEPAEFELVGLHVSRSRGL